MEITLEKVDKVKERTGVSYAAAKAALEATNGDVLEAIILIEKGTEEKAKSTEGKTETVDELKAWLKDLIEKGNVSRIKVSKDGKVLVDVPVNAGIAAGVIACVIPPILAFVVVAAVVTQVTIEITKVDGTVEVVNKYVTKTVNDVKEKASDLGEKVKEKFNGVNFDTNKKTSHDKKDEVDENVFTYTVNFDDDNDKKEE